MVQPEKGKAKIAKVLWFPGTYVWILYKWTFLHVFNIAKSEERLLPIRISFFLVPFCSFCYPLTVFKSSGSRWSIRQGNIRWGRGCGWTLLSSRMWKYIGNREYGENVFETDRENENEGNIRRQREKKKKGRKKIGAIQASSSTRLHTVHCRLQYKSQKYKLLPPVKGNNEKETWKSSHSSEVLTNKDWIKWS